MRLGRSKFDGDKSLPKLFQSQLGIPGGISRKECRQCVELLDT